MASAAWSPLIAADKAQPNQAVNFALMIHKIHTGEKMTRSSDQSYTIVGFGGSHNDFTEVRYPAMTPTGGVGDTAKCYMCHVNNSEAVFPIGKNNVTDPQGRIEPRRRPPLPPARLPPEHSRRCLTRYRRPIRSSVKAAMSATAVGKDFDVLKDTRRQVID